jgi:DNA processing protein
MTTPNIAYWLAALYLDNIGPLKIRRWLNIFSDIKELFSASPENLQFEGFSPAEIHALKNPDWKSVEKDLAWSKNPDCHLLTTDDAAYPMLLKELIDAPLVLYVKGDVDLLAQPQLAIVGSRNPTAAGKEIAEQFAYSLAQAGLIITSGLAAGIDAASHQGALAAGVKTIAVTGTGLNHVYPYSNRRLAAEIIAQGALVSEFTPDTGPIAKNFPRRNRIISGLSLGVLVVEAALRSGSLITARFASEQGREVFAIPGSIHNPLARGCHQIIQLGAKLVENVEDILEDLGSLRQAASISPPAKPALELAILDEKESLLLAKIGYEITALDTIIQRSGLTAAEVSSMLLSLELKGYVDCGLGGYVLSAASH